MQRPASVPEEAEYFADWDEWGVGGRVDGGMHGDWRLWRADGQFVEESAWRAGKCHGTKRRFHDDGTLSTVAEYEDGMMRRLEAHRPTNPTRDKDVDFDQLHGDVVRACFWAAPDPVTGGATTYRQEFWTADGTALDPFGVPVPPRPAGVPEHAWFNSRTGHWNAGRWTGTTPSVGLQVFWTADGLPVQVEYHRGGEHVACTGINNRGNPLIEAARDGDAEAVEVALAVGCGASPGAAAHAAYEGLPELALRLLTAPPRTGVVDPRTEPQDRRPAGDPTWIAGHGRYGGWYAGAIDPATGAAQGEWLLWEHAPYLDGDLLVETHFTDGQPRLRRAYGSVRFEHTGGREHRDGYLLDEEVRFAPYRKRTYDLGRIETERRDEPDGTSVSVRFHDNANPEVERVTRDKALVVEQWYDADGVRLAEVRPSAAPHLKASGKKVAVERFTGFAPDGTPIATGNVKAGPSGGPVGTWTLADTGEQVSFKPLRLRRRGDLGRIAHTMRSWHATPTLPGVETVKWAKLSTYFGSAKDFPFMLTGLVVGDPLAAELAVAEMYDPALHQGTIEEVTGPTARLLVAAMQRLDNVEAAVEPMRFLVLIASREGEYDAAAELKAVYRALPADAKPAKFFNKHDTEAGYHEVFAAIDAATPLWTDWSGHPSVKVRTLALLLLALAPGETAADALRERVRVETDPDLRAEALLGLGLHPATDATRALLAGHLGGGEPLLRLCAALTWLRLRLPDNDDAVGVLVEAIASDAPSARDDDGFDAMFLGRGDAAADAATALALLPPAEAQRHVERMAATLDQVNSINAIAVAGAMLDVVFPSDAYAEGEALTAAQRTAVGAIAASDNAWTFNVNLFEVLRANGLPVDRDALRVLSGIG